MNKNVKIDDRTHVRLKKEANKTGRLIGPLATELIGSALDAKSSSVKSTKTKKQP